jgi:hypothetical protein
MADPFTIDIIIAKYIIFLLSLIIPKFEIVQTVY